VVSTTPIVETAKQDLAHFYRGQSMTGTFRPGDALIVADMSIDSVHRGDVVLFRSMDADGEPEQVVHRVVAVLPEGLVTRGDNNRRVDLGLVTPDRLVGLVTHLERAGKRRRVRGSCIPEGSMCGGASGGVAGSLLPAWEEYSIAGCGIAASHLGCGSHPSQGCV
jgi:signal peptidase I